MKAGVALLIAAWLLLSGVAGQAAPGQVAPELPFEQAVKIATDYLRTHKLAPEHVIISFVLEPATIMRKKFHWVALWNSPVDLGGRRELGVQISMDGTIARVVDKVQK